MHMQVENTRRCCLAVSRGEVDLAVVGGQVPIDLEHILQVIQLIYEGLSGGPLTCRLHSSWYPAGDGLS